jgi:uncharacterized cupredoxin-like copper-binding protein
MIIGAAGCGSPGGVEVTMDEYSVDTDPRSAASGTVTFRARNVGALAHQLLVLETARDADELPVRGGLVRTSTKGIRESGQIEIIAADASKTLQAALAPGRYVLICNIAGHYDLGMRTAFLVSR